MASATSVEVLLYSELHCEDDHEISASEEFTSFDNRQWLNLCGQGVVSMKIPSGISIGVFAQCRGDDAMNCPSPNFRKLVTAPNSRGPLCINLSADGSPVESLSVSLMESFDDVCKEHLAHIDHFCEPKECEDECGNALKAGQLFSSQCEQVPVPSDMFSYHVGCTSEEESDDDIDKEIKGVSAKSVMPRIDVVNRHVPLSTMRRTHRQHIAQLKKLVKSDAAMKQTPEFEPKFAYPAFVDAVKSNQSDACDSDVDSEAVIGGVLIATAAVLMFGAVGLAYQRRRRMRQHRSLVDPNLGIIPMATSCPVQPMGGPVAVASSVPYFEPVKTNSYQKQIDQEQIDRDYAFAIRLAEQ